MKSDASRASAKICARNRRGASIVGPKPITLLDRVGKRENGCETKYVTHRSGGRSDPLPVFDDDADMRMRQGDEDRLRADPAAHVGDDRVPRKLVPGETCR